MKKKMMLNKNRPQKRALQKNISAYALFVSTVMQHKCPAWKRHGPLPPASWLPFGKCPGLHSRPYALQWTWNQRPAGFLPPVPAGSFLPEPAHILPGARFLHNRKRLSSMWRTGSFHIFSSAPGTERFCGHPELPVIRKESFLGDEALHTK